MIKYFVYVDGSNVEVIPVRDVTEDYLISLEKVGDALKLANFCEAEIDYITRCLSLCGIPD